MQTLSENTPLYQLTVGAFRELVQDELGKRMNPENTSGCSSHTAARLVYGLRGVQSLFNCSHKQAQYYKDHIIKEAVMQNGRKIVVDADYALQLFNERRAK